MPISCEAPIRVTRRTNLETLLGERSQTQEGAEWTTALYKASWIDKSIQTKKERLVDAGNERRGRRGRLSADTEF